MCVCVCVCGWVGGGGGVNRKDPSFSHKISCSFHSKMLGFFPLVVRAIGPCLLRLSCLLRLLVRNLNVLDSTRA